MFNYEWQELTNLPMLYYSNVYKPIEAPQQFSLVVRHRKIVIPCYPESDSFGFKTSNATGYSSFRSVDRLD